MATAFAEIAEDYSIENSEKIWSLCLKLANIPPNEAPTNNPKEFVNFCGAYSIGAIASTSQSFFEEALVLLRELADDPRWRIREAVAMGI